MLEAHPGAHARRELARVYGLGEVVVGARLEAADRILARAAHGREEDDGRVARPGIGLERAADGVAVLPGELHVEDDHVGGLGARGRERLVGVPRLVHEDLERLERLDDEPAVLVAVVHHEDARARQEPPPCANPPATGLGVAASRDSIASATRAARSSTS